MQIKYFSKSTHAIRNFWRVTKQKVWKVYMQKKKTEKNKIYLNLTGELTLKRAQLKKGIHVAGPKDWGKSIVVLVFFLQFFFQLTRTLFPTLICGKGILAFWISLDTLVPVSGGNTFTSIKIFYLWKPQSKYQEKMHEKNKLKFHTK